jgi:F0F1-type ATP synthase membrane subunit c/vacuolar-type H+-ATPase subunit K
MSKFLKSLALAIALLGMTQPSWAHSEISEASALSMLPVAVSVAAPALVLSGGVALTVVSVQASAVGTVWVLERASDGARITLNFSGQALTGAALSVGTAVAVTALATGWVLSAAGQAIAFVPNEIGRSLLHNERITR